MINVEQLFGQPVVSLGDAENKGTVKGLRFEGNRIVSIDIGGGRTIPAESVRTFEGDAITYEPSTFEWTPSLTAADVMAPDAADEPMIYHPDPLLGQILSDDSADDREDHAPLGYPTVAWSGDPIGKVLLSNAGNALGKLTEMHVGADGIVIEIADDEGHTYAGDRLLTVGSYAAIVTEADDHQQVQAASNEQERQQRDRAEEIGEEITAFTLDEELAEVSKATERSTVSPEDMSSSDPRTRDELYEEAKDLNIPGRSSMDKDELQRAIDSESKG